jgi:hypothetical protein
VRLSPLGTVVTTGLLYPPQMIDDGDCGAFGGMMIDRGNRSARRTPPTPLCSPQITHDQTRAAVLGSRRLTAWALPRPIICYNWSPFGCVITGETAVRRRLGYGWFPYEYHNVESLTLQGRNKVLIGFLCKDAKKINTSLLFNLGVH